MSHDILGEMFNNFNRINESYSHLLVEFFRISEENDLLSGKNHQLGKDNLALIETVRKHETTIKRLNERIAKTKGAHGN